MADNRLNKTGLRYLLSKMMGFFALQSDLKTLQDEVDELITEGGEPNVIEVIKKNGTALTPDANKAVDMSVPTIAKSGSGENEKVTLAEGQDSFDVPTVDAMEDYVSEHGGVIQKFKVNGTEQSIDPSDKSVDITVPTAGSAQNTSGYAVYSDMQTALAGKANTADIPTAISDALANSGDPYQTESDVDDKIASQIGSVYKPKGSVTFANLPQLSATELGHVYNVTDAFTTTSDFKEGAGISVPAGTNVAIINDGTDQNPVYKYDLMSGFVDLSDYWNATNLPALTTAEIDEVWNSVFNPTP